MSINPATLDQEICLCFHVTRRKIVNFIRVERPQRASQLSQCGGAGTGCGWCRVYLERLFHAAQPDSSAAANEPGIPTAEQYAAGRQSYIQAGRGTPPASAPLADPPPA